jgi:hypothetical protein
MNADNIISNEQIESLERIATIIARSGMGGFKSSEQAMVALLLALAEGIPFGRIIHEYHVINGRLSLRSECMLARFQQAGGTIQYIDRGPACVTVSATHPKGGSLTVTWTMARAREAGLTSNPTWAKHPTAMLAARAIAEAVRAVYPACLSGIIAEEEAEEIGAPARPEAASLPTPPTRRTRGNGSNGTDIRLTPARPVAASEPEPVTLTVVTEAPAPEPAPAAAAPQPEALEPAEPETHKPGRNADAFWHPLDAALGGLNQDKLTAFLLKQGLITEGQSYKHCGPKATSRILKQLPSFLKAAGFDEELPS